MVRRWWLAALGVVCAGTARLGVAAEAGPGGTALVDWTETARNWYTQSYWTDPKLLQRYTFSAEVGDLAVGASSTRVHMEVAAERPGDVIELRLEPPQPLDLSQVEAVEVSLKLLTDARLQPRDVFFCDPGFNKLTIASWPANLGLENDGQWHRAILDLAEARVLDKAKPQENGQYDRHDVVTICLNFLLPSGAVDLELLVDGMRPVALPPPPVTRQAQPDGSYLITATCYRAVVGGNGYLQSLRAGTTEFLTGIAVAAGPAGQTTASGCFVDNTPAKGLHLLKSVAPQGRTGLTASGEAVSLQYVFREGDVDIVLQQSFTPQAGLLQFGLAQDVVAALDGQTDQPLLAAKAETGPQIDTRLVTRSGGVLKCRQYVVGYSRLSLATLPEKVWALQFMAWGQGPNKLTLEPAGAPAAPDAIGLGVAAADPDFVLPGGQPVHFGLTATSYAAGPAKVRVSFQVCDYLTKAAVGERVTELGLDPGQTVPVPTGVAVAAPGPYRALVTVADGAGAQRSIGWVFTYDFAGYRPASTRPADFQAFWQETLAELAQVPMDAQLTPVPDQSTPEAEAFKLSLATLSGRRVYGWYWKPRQAGRYPAGFEVPSSGVYPVTADRAPHGADRCGLWLSIHGLPVDLDLKNLPQDPAALNYWTYGIESPKTSMWRVIYASLVRGVDFLCSRDEVDPTRIMVSGGSQGGGLSMVLAGLDRRIAFSAPAHSGLARLDWTVVHAPGFWPFSMAAKPAGQTTEEFLKTLSYFDAASFTPDIECPVVAEVSLLDTVTASGNQICALAHIKPGLLELICDPWCSHASSPRGAQLRWEAIARWYRGEPPVRNPIRK